MLPGDLLELGVIAAQIMVHAGSCHDMLENMGRIFPVKGLIHRLCDVGDEVIRGESEPPDGPLHIPMFFPAPRTVDVTNVDLNLGDDEKDFPRLSDPGVILHGSAHERLLAVRKTYAQQVGFGSRVTADLVRVNDESWYREEAVEAEVPLGNLLCPLAAPISPWLSTRRLHFSPNCE